MTSRGGRRAVGPDLDRLIADGLARLPATVTPPGRARQPGDSPPGAPPGAAGVLTTLNRAARVLDDPAIARAVAEVAARIDRRDHERPRVAAGVGGAYAAWTLHDAADVLGDGALAARALELAGSLPVDAADPSVRSGLSGAGLTHVYLWRQTGDAALWKRVLGFAEAVLSAVQGADGSAWTRPAEPGYGRYGFAHGVAGVGTFLVEAVTAAGPDDPVSRLLLDAALQAGEILIDAARSDVHGHVCWPLDAGVDAGVGRSADDDGPVGIGDFLARLWALTGWPRADELAREVAGGTVAAAWRTGPGVDYDIGAAGHFLLSLAELTADGRYRSWAEDVAYAIAARTGIPGSAGELDFLLRLRRGGPPPWLPFSSA